MIPVSEYKGVLSSLLVGLVWGVTNAFTKRGSDAAQAKARKLGGQRSVLLCYVTTLSFIVPQVLNYSASALFAYLLGEVDLTVLVPVANATALLCNALTDLLLGQRYHLGYLSLGVVLVAAGVLLCGVPSQALEPAQAHVRQLIGEARSRAQGLWAAATEAAAGGGGGSARPRTI